MPTFVSKRTSVTLMGVTLLLVLAGAACQPQPGSNTNTSTTSNTANDNATTTSNANATAPTPSGVIINSREPDQYSATVTFKVELTGTQNISTPPLSAEFTRSGANRRIAVKLPGGDQVVYLDRADKRYIIVPNRKQYAEIDATSTGFDVPTMMTPSQIVNQVKSVRGCENVAEETFGGRAAIKYRCAGAAKTGTQAGDVKAESFIYIDKETNLPLRTESVVSTSTNVGGASAVKIVTEMSNIQTNVPTTAFDAPVGMKKVDPAQVRSQVEAVLKAALFFAQNVMQGSSAPTPSATDSPMP